MAKPGRHPSPTLTFHKRPLSVIRVPKTHQWFRLHRSEYAPLHFSATGLRFDSPQDQFGVLYVARQIEGAFVEVFCRNGGALRPIRHSRLNEFELALITATRGLKLVDLAGKGLARMGLDSRLTSGDYRVAQRWSAAIYAHPDTADGILYPPRHDPKQQCAALFDRCEILLEVRKLGRLQSYVGDPHFFALLDRYGVALL